MIIECDDIDYQCFCISYDHEYDLYHSDEFMEEELSVSLDFVCELQNALCDWFAKRFDELFVSIYEGNLE